MALRPGNHIVPASSMTDRMLPPGSFEPRDRWTVSSHDSFLVRLEVGQIVLLKADTALFQFLDGKIDIFHREIEDSERRWNVVGLGINDHVVTTSEAQRNHAVRSRNAQPERCGIEFFRL